MDDWTPALVAIEAKAKEDCKILLFVISDETRALVCSVWEKSVFGIWSLNMYFIAIEFSL